MSTEFYKPRQGDTAAAVADGYDKNFQTLEASKETPAGAQAKANAALSAAQSYAEEIAGTKSEATLRSANDYTDTREAAILAVVDNKATEALQGSKEYTDTTVAGFVGTAPDLLNTLQEIAAALNNDPNFSTTILQKLAEKLDAVNYTAADVLAKLLTVSGYGSKLVSDFIADRRDATALGVWTGTQSEYDAVAIKDPRTLYIVL